MTSPDLYTEDHLSRQKLPPYDGIVFRAATLEPAEIARYVPGYVVTEPVAVSATPDPATRFTGNVEFVIYSRSARDVSLYAAQPAKPELLFHPGTSFLVRSIGPVPALPDAVRVVLEEVETADHAFVVITHVEYGPPELVAQLPLHCELVRSLPGAGVADYHLARTPTTPVYFPQPHPPMTEEQADLHWRRGYPREDLDVARVDPKLLRQAPDGRDAVVLPALVLAPRDGAATIDSTARNLEVDLHYVIDPTQLVEPEIDPAKLFFAAVVRVDSVLRPLPAPEPPEPEPAEAEEAAAEKNVATAEPVAAEQAEDRDADVPDVAAAVGDEAASEVDPTPDVAADAEPAAADDEAPASTPTEVEPVRPEADAGADRPEPLRKLGTELTTTFGRDTVIALIHVPRPDLEHALGHRFDLIAGGTVAALILELLTGETVAVLGPADPTVATFSLQQHDSPDPSATIAHFCELSGIPPQYVAAASSWQSEQVPPAPPTAPAQAAAPPDEPEPAAPPPVADDGGWHIWDRVAVARLPEPDAAAMEMARHNPNSYLNYRDPALPEQSPTRTGDILGGRRVDAAGQLTDEVWINPDYVPQPATAGYRFDNEFELVYWRILHGYNTIAQFLDALSQATLIAAGAAHDPMPLDAPAQPDGHWIIPVFTSDQFTTEGTDVRRLLSGAQILDAVSGRPGGILRINPGSAQATDLTGANLAAWWAESLRAAAAPPDPAAPAQPETAPAAEEQNATQLIEREPPAAAAPAPAPIESQVSTSALINTLCYTLQFASDLSEPAILARTADGMINHVGYRDPVEDFYRALAETVGRGTIDQTALEMARVHNEAELLDFFATLVRTLDERRPWPAPLFVKLEADPWPTSGWTQPIALLRIPRYRLEGRVNHIFDAVPDNTPPVLILRMRSGEVIALVGAPSTDPTHRESSDYALLQRYPGDPAEVIAHFCGYSGIDPASVHPL